MENKEKTEGKKLEEELFNIKKSGWEKATEEDKKMIFGEMSEWFKELVLKTSDSERGRGFESHPLRHIGNERVGTQLRLTRQN